MPEQDPTITKWLVMNSQHSQPNRNRSGKKEITPGKNGEEIGRVIEAIKVKPTAVRIITTVI